MIKDQSGQILVLVLVALGVVLFTTLFIIGGGQIYFQNAQYSTDTEKAIALAEAGVDKALTSLNATGGSYNGESETVFGEGSYSVVITNIDAGNKILHVTGFIPNKANPKTKRTVSVQATKGVGIAFNYGLQVGNGGISMGNDSLFNGSVYSNGSISGGNNTIFTGDVWIAGASQATAEQQSDCSGIGCQDYIFGKNVGGENRQDVAQSFNPSVEEELNKVSLKLKKVGSPANLTVRIMNDLNGEPNKNGILATGTLSASLVTENYSFVDVTFDTMPNLSDDETYWIMIHSVLLDNSNYWVWSLDSSQGYSQGLPKWSSNWQAGNPTWSTILGDLGFKTYMGGVVTSLNLTNGSRVNGNVHANTIEGNMTITKDAYYQAINPSVTVNGAKYPNSPDSAPATFPVSEANIAEWKSITQSMGESTGNITSCVETLGPGKINGNVSIEDRCEINVNSPVWITGTLTVGNNITFTLDQDFGAASGMIIVDGKVILGNGVDFVGSGTEGSFLMLLSTYNSYINGDKAIDSGNSSISGIVYVPYGKVTLANGASFGEITAWGIELGNGAVLNYQTGFAQTFFSSGPSGAFSLVKGTYQVK